MSTTGTINVQTENIFPIIKKFLYSDHEIFLRELVSNAVDASKKLKALNSLGEFKGELGTLNVTVSIDKNAKTITVSDNGIGMTEEEVEKYITQVAFSGAEEFVQKYKDKTDAVQGIIGHFGLGFYSAFMVAAKVELITKSYKDDSSAVKWSCDGSPNYTIEPTERSGRGTDVVLHVAEDSLEFLEEDRIEGILTKYCKFLPVEIRFGTHEIEIVPAEKDKDGKEIKAAEKETVPTIINNPSPAWTKKPADLTDEDYKKFYGELYPMNFDEPLFWIHLNVDYPFNLTGILYFPKIKKSFEVQKEKIQLYCNQVFVTDNVGEIVPDFLTLLRGVIDSPDIPLNVSRSYLQSDSNVKKISAHITKKVADKLEELFKKDRADFESKWEDIRIFVNYGMISDEKFYEKAQKFALLKNTDGKCFTIDEYKEKVKASQTDKDGRLVMLYTNNAEEQHSFIDSAKSRGYDVLVFDSMIDPHYINHMESKLEKVSFVRVDSDTVDKLIKKSDDIPSKLSEKEQEEIKAVVESVMPKEKFSVSFESLLDTDPPMLVTRPEFMRRMKDMSALSGGSRNMFGNFPDMHNLVINSNHPLAGKILSEKDEAKKKQLVKQAGDLALLAQGLLKGEELTNFIKRSTELIG
ncbi:MAG TPA: molecular chaperone HtpG [Bacteroidia bacterium]|jgi:molecular chaperone HtpG|nr:molecular chaperone HtpG [Bacteroidia bacterium]